MQKSKIQDSKNKAILSLKKVNGTLQKVLKMISEDRYCPDIIQQIDAVIGLLKSGRKNLLVGHFNYCLPAKIVENRDQTINELLKIYSLGDK
ncbi:MAG: hypothetical protein Fur0024_1660 [Patescibacteria group bacterium]